MTVTREHLAGLELALQQWNNGGPAAHFAALLRGLIEQAQQANHSEHDLNMVAPVSEAKAPEPVERVISKPQTCNGKRCGWCKEGAEPCHYAAPVVSESAGSVLLAEAVEVLREVFDAADAGETLGAETIWRAERVFKGRRIYVDDRSLATENDFNQRDPVVSAEQRVVPQCFAELLHHAHGMTMGTDWNKGTMAGYHREPLGEAVVQCQVWLAAAPAPSTTEGRGDD